MDDSASERPGGREAPSTLERTILDLVRRYVRERAEKRSGRTVDEFKNKKTVGEDGKERIDVPKEYADAQAKIALQLFLEVRSRHDADFAQYFAEHFGAVGQGSLRNVDRFQSVCEALIKRPDQVRIVTLLALSAAS